MSEGPVIDPPEPEPPEDADPLPYRRSVDISTALLTQILTGFQLGGGRARRFVVVENAVPADAENPRAVSCGPDGSVVKICFDTAEEGEGPVLETVVQTLESDAGQPEPGCCFDCGDGNTTLHCLNCAEKRITKKVAGVAGVLHNALRYLDRDDLISIASAIADRCGLTLTKQ